MGSICVCAAKGCCGKQKSCCCCIPLAAGAAAISAVWVISGILQIVQGAVPINDDIWMITAGSINLFVGLMGLAACFVKIACGAMLMFYAFCCTLVLNVIFFTIQWVDWGTALADGVIVFGYEMVVYTLVQVLLFGLTWWVCDLFFSMNNVLKRGGNPWKVDKGSKAGSSHAKSAKSEIEVRDLEVAEDNASNS
eukprot:Selendium_serpulae@DN6101_c0_g1_i11.p1